MPSVRRRTAAPAVSAVCAVVLASVPDSARAAGGAAEDPQALTALLWLAGLLLAAAGVGKLRHPALASAAFGKAHLPTGVWSIRAFAAGEIVLGAAAVLAPVPALVAATAAAFAAFAVFTAALLARGERSVSCGCFGTADVGLSWAHPVLNAALAAAVLGSLATGAQATPPAAGGSANQAVALVALSVVGAYVAGAVLAVGGRAPTTSRTTGGHHHA